MLGKPSTPQAEYYKYNDTWILGYSRAGKLVTMKLIKEL